MLDLSERIFITGHRGMVGSALHRILMREGYRNFCTASRSELDLRQQTQVETYFREHRPTVVFLAAARVGGIKANMEGPGQFLYDNLMIQTNVIQQCLEHRVKKVVFLGSSCIYPRNCPQPIKEEYLMTGPLEPTNEGYAIAKIAGLRLSQYYAKQFGLSVLNPMPCNLYGTNDHFEFDRAHVLSSLVHRFVDAVDDGASEVVVWGTGSARREFMHVDDFAEAVLLLVNRYTSSDLINVGCGTDLTIKELAELVAKETGFKGRLVWDTKMPDGMPRKCLDVSRLQALGFRPRIALPEGISRTVADYRQIKANRDP